MKIILSLFYVAALCTGLVLAGSTADPPFSGVFYAVKDGQFLDLERQRNRSEMLSEDNPDRMISKYVTKYSGATSPVRLHRGVVEFIIKSNPYDPGSYFALRRIQTVGDSRESILSPHSVSNDIHFKFSKYSADSLVITATLSPGEYAIGQPRGDAVFCFGVD